jgi:hypothetical protein
MWNDERFRKLSAPKPNAQTLWKRLLTGPELTNIPGLFSVRLAGLADALGWPLAATKKCWKEIEAQGMARADWKAGLVWLPNAVQHNKPQSLNVVRSWGPTIAELPECALRDEAVAALRISVEAMGDAWADAFREALGDGKAHGLPDAMADGMGDTKTKASPIQEQEQEILRKKDARARDGTQKPAGTIPPDLLPSAEDVEFARQQGLQDIEQAWLLFRSHHIERQTLSADWSASWRKWVINGVTIQRRERDRQRNSGKFASRPEAVEPERAARTMSPAMTQAERDEAVREMLSRPKKGAA